MQLICKKRVLKRKHFQFFLRSTPSAWRKRRGPRKTMILSRNVTSVKDTLEKTWCIPLNSTWQRPPIVSSADVSLDVRIGAPCIYYLIFWHGFFIHCFIHCTIFEREHSCSWWQTSSALSIDSMQTVIGLMAKQCFSRCKQLLGRCPDGWW